MTLSCVSPCAKSFACPEGPAKPNVECSQCAGLSIIFGFQPTGLCNVNESMTEPSASVTTCNSTQLGSVACCNTYIEHPWDTNHCLLHAVTFSMSSFSVQSRSKGQHHANKNLHSLADITTLHHQSADARTAVSSNDRIVTCRSTCCHNHKN